MPGVHYTRAGAISPTKADPEPQQSEMAIADISSGKHFTKYRIDNESACHRPAILLLSSRI